MHTKTDDSGSSVNLVTFTFTHLVTQFPVRQLFLSIWCLLHVFIRSLLLCTTTINERLNEFAIALAWLVIMDLRSFVWLTNIRSLVRYNIHCNIVAYNGRNAVLISMQTACTVVHLRIVPRESQGANGCFWILIYKNIYIYSEIRKSVRSSVFTYSYWTAMDPLRLGAYVKFLEMQTHWDLGDNEHDAFT